MGEPKEMESRDSKVMGELGKGFAQARILRSIEGEGTIEVGVSWMRQANPFRC